VKIEEKAKALLEDLKVGEERDDGFMPRFIIVRQSVELIQELVDRVEDLKGKLSEAKGISELAVETMMTSRENEIFRTWEDYRYYTIGLNEHISLVLSEEPEGGSETKDGE